jgi:hypothetical protein
VIQPGGMDVNEFHTDSFLSLLFEKKCNQWRLRLPLPSATSFIVLTELAFLGATDSRPVEASYSSHIQVLLIRSE